MKKIFCLIAVALLVSALATPVFSIEDEKELQIYVSVNTSNYGKVSAISTSSIRPGKDFIIGYSITTTQNNALSTENVIGLYDSTAALASTTTIFAENEARDGEGLEVMWPRGKKIGTQLTIAQGAYTIVTIYYEKRYP